MHISGKCFSTQILKNLRWSNFLQEKKEETHPSVCYNKIEVSRMDSQKHLDLVLDNKLTFKKHIKDKLNKVYFGVGK